MIGSLLVIAGGALLGSASLYQLEITRNSLFSVASPQRGRWRLSRQTLGLLTGTVLALMIASIAPAFGLEGSVRLINMIAAGIAFLTFGLVIPRAPLVQEERRRKALRLCLPAALTQWRIGVQAGDTLVEAMQRYVSVPRKERVVMQDLIRRAQQMIADGATRSYIDPETGRTEIVHLLFAEALVEQAQRTGSPEVINVMRILANADRQGGIRTAVPALERESETLQKIIGHEIDELIAKRGLKMIAAAAPAVAGTVVLILFIAAAGGTVGF